MKRQRGIALITAIFVVALASIAAVAMFEAANIAVHRSANLVQSETELWYATGIESWVKGILLQDYKLTGNKTVGLNGIWAQPVDFLPIDGGGIRGHLEDLQGRFNLNNLGVGQLNTNASSATLATGPMLYIQQFDRLLDNLPNFDGSKYQGMGYAIRDWIDADDQRSGSLGAEDQDYLSQDPPYRAANQPMHSVSELMLVKGMTKELYSALLPYVAALPVTTPGSTTLPTAASSITASVGSGTVTPININTAPEPVLMSLVSNISNRAALEKFIAVRKTQPATTTTVISGTGEFAFIPSSTVAGTAGGQVAISVNSNYFELQAEVFIGSGRLALYSVLYRPSSGVSVVLAHSTNTE